MLPDLQAKIALWRQKALEGTLTPQEMFEAIRALRESRMSARDASDSAKRRKAIAAIPDADDMLKEIMGGL